MEDLDFLADDHTVLGSQVIHVVALLRAYGEGRYVMARIDAEIVRQAEILQSQLAEHFAFEEVTAFPRLGVMFPQFKSRLQAMLDQHAVVFEAFELLSSALNAEPAQLNPADLVAKGTAFGTAFERHATEETELLKELSALVAAGHVSAQT